MKFNLGLSMIFYCLILVVLVVVIFFISFLVILLMSFFLELGYLVRLFIVVGVFFMCIR